MLIRMKWWASAFVTACFVALALAIALGLAACGTAEIQRPQVSVMPSSIPDESDLNIGTMELGLMCATPMLTTYTMTFVDGNGVTRTARVDSPVQRDPNVAAALYIGLHGAGGTSNSIQGQRVSWCTGTQWIAIYPQGVYQPPPINGIAWNATPESVDVHLIDTIVAWAEMMNVIDTTKIRVYGFSMGSLMSVTMGLTRPGVYEAVGVVCGEIPWTMMAPYPTTALNFYQTSGDQDTTFTPALARSLHDLVVANDSGLISTSPGYNADCLFYNVVGGQLVEWCDHRTTGHTWTLNDTLALGDAFTRLGL